MVLGTVRWEAGPQQRRPNTLKAKLTQGGPLGSSPLRSDGSQEAGHPEIRSKTLKGGLENNSRIPRDLVGELA
jgi:hypothetical protein